MNYCCRQPLQPTVHWAQFSIELFLSDFCQLIQIGFSLNRPERSIVKQTLKLYIVHSVIHSSLTIDAKMIIENGEHLILTTFPTSQTFFVSSEMNLGTLLFIRLMITKSLAKFNMTTLTFSELKKCIYPNSDLKIRYFKFGQILKNSRTKSLSLNF